MARTGGSRTAHRVARLACMLALLAPACAALAPAALAAPPSLTWSGAQESPEDEWSLAGNWAGGKAPTAGEALGTLTFPRLTSSACTGSEPEGACYESEDDLAGLSAEALKLDDGDGYRIEGNALTLGSGGLAAAPASGSSGAALEELELPLALGAAQKWSITGRGGSADGQNGVDLYGELTGSGHALEVALGSGGALELESESEVGPVKLTGASATAEDAENGTVRLLGAELNLEDGHTVEASHVVLAGDGWLGPLITNHAQLEVGDGREPASGIEAASATFDAGSEVTFQITGASREARTGYSQLYSEGAVALGGATVGLVVAPPAEGRACPTLTQGETFTFVSTTGSLSGSFANAPEHGVEVPVRFAAACKSSASQTIRMSYQESGPTQTVTGTVEAAAVEAQEAQKAREAQQAQEAQQAHEAQQAQEAREARERRETAERLAAEAALAKKHEEEAAARRAAEAQHPSAPEGPPDATVAGSSLSVSASGAVVVKIACPAGESRCSGSITLRSLHPVSATGRSRPAVLTLASGAFAVAGGHVASVTLHLSAAARRLLAHGALAARATVLAHDPAGASHTSLSTVTLRLARHAKP